MSNVVLVNERIKAEVFYWFFAVVFFVAYIVFSFAAPTINVRHSYELPTTACLNQLTSDLWGWEFMQQRFFALFLLIPLSGLFMIWSKRGTGIWAHFFVIFLLLLWGIVILGYDIKHITTANLAPTDVKFNPSNLATDKRFCLVYAGSPGTELLCHITTPCNATAVDPNSLHVDGTFMWHTAMDALMVCFALTDFVFTLYTWRVAFNNWNESIEPTKTIPKTPKKEESDLNAPIRYNLLKNKQNE